MTSPINRAQLEQLVEVAWQLCCLHLQEQGNADVCLVLVGRSGPVGADGTSVVLRYSGPTPDALQTMAKVGQELMAQIRNKTPEVQNATTKT